MNYLYAALGIAMISGISIMFRINNLINNRINLSNFIEDKYINSNIPKYDKQIINKFYLPSVPDNNICSYIIDSITFPKYKLGKNTPSRNDRLLLSCSIVSQSVNHRVIIDKTDEKNKNYKLFSCLLDKDEVIDDAICKFEK